MVCCPYSEVSEKPLCNIHGDLMTKDLLNRKATFLKLFSGKSETSCGIRTIDQEETVRISEGEEAAPGDWPWMALLGYTHCSSTCTHSSGGATEPSFECGGTLISLKNVLTSAHCLDKR